MFEKIKKWYAMGLWSSRMVEQAAAKAVLTQAQAAEILRSEEG